MVSHTYTTALTLLALSTHSITVASQSTQNIYDVNPNLQTEAQLYGANYEPSVTGVAIGASFYLLILVICIPFSYWTAFHHGPDAMNVKHTLMSADRSQWSWVDKLCARKSFPYILLALNFIPFSLYVSAAVFDNWSVYSGPDYAVPIYFGIQNAHVNTSGLGGVNDYMEFCQSLNSNSATNTVCGLTRFGAYMTVVGYALALLTFFVTLVWIIVRHRREVKAVSAGQADTGLWTTRLLFVFHLNGTFQGMTLISWAIVAHIGLESLLNTHGNELMFTYCWWLLLASSAFCFIPQLLARRSYMRHQFRLGTTEQQMTKNTTVQPYNYKGTTQEFASSNADANTVV